MSNCLQIEKTQPTREGHLVGEPQEWMRTTRNPVFQKQIHLPATDSPRFYVITTKEENEEGLVQQRAHEKSRGIITY